MEHQKIQILSSKQYSICLDILSDQNQNCSDSQQFWQENVLCPTTISSTATMPTSIIPSQLASMVYLHINCFLKDYKGQNLFPLYNYYYYRGTRSYTLISYIHGYIVTMQYKMVNGYTLSAKQGWAVPACVFQDHIPSHKMSSHYN